MSQGPEHAPAGWYNDPHAPDRMRYFDGQEWTNHFHQPGKLPDIGSWLNTTFSVFGQYWRGAALLAAGTSIVGTAGAWIALRWLANDLEVVDEQFVNFDAGTAIGLALVVVFGFLWQGFGWIAMSRFMQRAHFQAEPTVTESLIHAVRRLPKYVAITLALALAAVLIMILAAFLAVAVPVLGVLVILGLIVASVWVVVKLAFLVTAIAVAPANTPVVRASAEVSAGRFWPVLGRLLLVFIGLAVVGQIAAIGLGEYGQVVDANALQDIVQVDDDTLVIRNFRVVDLLPSTGQLVFVLLLNSLIQGATSLISTSALVRLYLDSGAPSETLSD